MRRILVISYHHFCNKNVTAKLEKVTERAHFQLKTNKSKTGLPSLANQCLAKIVCTVFKVLDSNHAPRSIKVLIAHRNSYYDLRGNNILRLPKANT